MLNHSRTASHTLRPSTHEPAARDRRRPRSLRPPGPHNSLLATALAACALAAPGCQTATTVPKGPWDGPQPGLIGAPIVLPRGGVWTEISLIEESRTTGSGRLIELLLHESAAVRERVCRALGRLRHPAWGAAITTALSTQLSDGDAGVRRAAAFALGQRADPSAASILINHWSDEDATVRAALVRAAGSIDVPQVRAEVLRAMRDPSVRVRIEAAQATALWDTDQPDAAAIDSGLLALLRPRDGSVVSEPELIWRTLFALQRRESASGRGAYLEFADHAEPLVRLFAAKGLGTVPSDGDTGSALAKAIADDDWRIATEAARALGKQRAITSDFHPDENVATLLGAIEHTSIHVRRTAIEALGQIEHDTQDIRSALYRGLRDLSPSVRASSLEALARVMPPEEALSVVSEHLEDEEPALRIGSARAASYLPTRTAVPILIALTRDSDPGVANTALEMLGDHPTPEVRTTLRETLEAEDNGRRLAALTALAKNPRASDVPIVRKMLRDIDGDIADEIAYGVADFIQQVPNDLSRATLAELFAHSNGFVRDRAREVWSDTRPLEAYPRVISPAVETPELGELLRIGWTRNPIVEIATTRGSMFFELFPEEAPVHVYNFLVLAEQGHYDGLSFHRVVSDFVIQGGCYRGDGNGGLDWRGRALRQEFGERKFTRGSLGMPRNADPESGGSQIFVTHRPTPHLDGKYTLFGELRLGQEVLDRIDVGDHILGARLLSQGAAPLRRSNP